MITRLLRVTRDRIAAGLSLDPNQCGIMQSERPPAVCGDRFVAVWLMNVRSITTRLGCRIRDVEIGVAVTYRTQRHPFDRLPLGTSHVDAASTRTFWEDDYERLVDLLDGSDPYWLALNAELAAESVHPIAAVPTFAMDSRGPQAVSYDHFHSEDEPTELQEIPGYVLRGTVTNLHIVTKPDYES